MVVLAVRGGVMGRWNRNIGRERLVPEPWHTLIQLNPLYNNIVMELPWMATPHDIDD